jgi:pheromone shutdown-related protein TraB
MDKSIDQNQTSKRILKINDKEIILIGTAHVSDQSVKEVREAIEEHKPDSIAVELCQSRFDSLKDKNRWENLDIIKVIKQGQGFLLFTSMILSSFQKRIGLDLGTNPGEEMITAIQMAEEKNLPIILADRDINTTLKRAWALSKFKDKIKIIDLIIESIFTREKVSKEEVKDLLENNDLLSSMMDEFSQQLPSVKKVLIDERDTFIAEKIKNANCKKILAVVGKGHLDGIVKKIESNYDYDPSIETVPAKKGNTSLIGWLLTILILGIFAAGFFTKGPKVGIEMLKYWVLISGFCCSVSALLVMAHPLTILSAWLIAPITTLNPVIGAGMFLSLIEAVLRKPKVADFENISEDVTKFKGFFKNRILRILVIFIVTSIGASIGTFIGIPWITSLLK